ncbi:MAG TPA: hypothetical protein VFX17_04195 [Patescibacteria group bacterium]|nr:hypothetical protein [Patescibacteria group bacterium]
MTDCEKLSLAAQAIFGQLKPFFPPDPWNKPQWIEEGVVIDNGQHDLRKSADRAKLIEKTEATLGSFVEVAARSYRRKNGSLEGFEIDHFGPMIKNKVELLFILEELNFQIETMDLVT